MSAIRCPRCGGEAVQPIAPGYWECVSLVDADFLQQYDEQGEKSPDRPRMTCRHRFAFGVPSDRPPACECGTFAIGTCAECGQPVCGDHSSMRVSRRLCVTHSSAEAEEIAAALEERWSQQIARLATLRPEAVADLEHLRMLEGTEMAIRDLDYHIVRFEHDRRVSSEAVPASPPPPGAGAPSQHFRGSAEDALRARAAAERTSREEEARRRRADDRATVAAKLPALRALIAETLDHLSRMGYPGGELLYFYNGRGRRSRRPRAAWLLFTRQGAWERDGYRKDKYYLLANGEIWGLSALVTVKVKLDDLSPVDVAEAEASLRRIQSSTQ